MLKINEYILPRSRRKSFNVGCNYLLPRPRCERALEIFDLPFFLNAIHPTVSILHSKLATLE